MSSTTSHYGFTKPATSEAYNVGVQNENMDKADAAIWGLPATYKRTLTENDVIDSLSDGIYYLTNSLPSGIPAEAQWCFLYQVSNSAIIHQYIIRPAGGNVYVREHSGSPSVWTGWHCICGHSAVTRINYGSNSYVEYWRNGQVGCLKIMYYVSDGSISAWSTKEIATIPNGFRPAQSIMMRGIVDRAGDEGVAFSVDSNGSVKIQTRHNSFGTSGGALQGTLTYPIRY